MINLTVARNVKKLMQKYNFHTKKSYGQNFLTNEEVLQTIVESAQLDSEDIVVEIGPGLGTLTQFLAANAKKVLAVELDKTLLPVLAETLSDFSNVQVINQDILKIDLDEVVRQEIPPGQELSYKVVANLPYYITTPIIMHLLEQRYHISSITIMVQLEVAARMAARPGGKDYGALSLAVQYYTEPELITKVPPSSFIPAPEVESAVMKLTLRAKPPVQVADEKLFFSLIKTAFAQRRKTLLNALSHKYTQLPKEKLTALLESCGIDPQRRGETLSLEEYALLTKIFSD
ncbi:16S rRNA (adenine(1518)-N(6)/adenine(1519)-N(6))-dimethyltransferase RsmA [Bacillota bacterium LX-D]|nr:16S rRNA (adenine(1518)-N(6)/adenine(1519)-N(6))-dimethyltransferase RsmA [Bacillota bacterium LX-D]